MDLAYKNPFYLSEYVAGKHTAMDIKVETSLGEQIDLEMQVENLSEYVNRTILYTAQISTEGLESGQAADIPRLSTDPAFLEEMLKQHGLA